MELHAKPLADVIVPTPVGVNRRNGLDSQARAHCPHARGGEPYG